MGMCGLNVVFFVRKKNPSFARFFAQEKDYGKGSPLILCVGSFTEKFLERNP